MKPLTTNETGRCDWHLVVPVISSNAVSVDLEKSARMAKNADATALMLHKMELLAHRDFINAIQAFCNQATLPQEVSENFVTMIHDYKGFCATFIGDTDAFLVQVDADDKVAFAPEIMERERFHLLGLMLKMLCVLTEQNGAIKI